MTDGCTREEAYTLERREKPVKAKRGTTLLGSAEGEHRPYTDCVRDKENSVNTDLRVWWRDERRRESRQV